jgi:hypothetical protein
VVDKRWVRVITNQGASVNSCWLKRIITLF